jgi:hypothetical protein
MIRISLTLAATLLLILSSCRSEPELTAEEARLIAKEAYVYGFPMVVHYKVLHSYTLDPGSPEYKGPFNTLKCEARVYTPEDKAVVTPNSDTPYCMGWMDIRNDPLVISLPEVDEGRYVSFQLIDAFTHNFAYLGSLSTGSDGGTYLVALDSWEGAVPDGIDEVIRCETGAFMIIARTQLKDSDDIENVARIQDAYSVEPLRVFQGDPAMEVKETIEFPDWNEGDQFTASAFQYVDVMLKFAEVHSDEVILRRRLARLGLGTDKGFDLAGFEPEIKEAIETGVKEGFAEMEAFVAEYSSDPLISAKIFGTRSFLKKTASGEYGLEDHFLPRAVGAHMGLYGNSGLEAVYPVYLVDDSGQPLNAAENRYALRFESGELPPVKAFWSLTMYDGQTQLLINNPLDRYLLNSAMAEQFIYGEDGSLTLYLQQDSPGTDLEPNWLPAPEGPFYCVLRLYGPKQQVLEGNWVNPPLVKVE